MNHGHGCRNALVVAVLPAAMLLLAWNMGAAGGYTQTNLTSDQTGVGMFTDPNLKNAWGIAASTGGPFWIADTNTGKSTVYLDTGKPTPPVVMIPKASGTGKSQPTGIVFNSTTDFVITSGSKSGPASFLFDSEDGAISGWNSTVLPTTAVIAVNNAISGADYKGLAIGVSAGANVLYAANFNAGEVEMYDAHFNLIKTFTDTTVAAGYAPFGIQNINGTLYVTFAKQDAQKKNHIACAGCGFVSTFDQSGNFIKQLVAMGKLNAPWGLAIAPSNFKKLSNDLLVGNVGDGRINAYNFTTGAFVAAMTDSTGKAISINGLWGLLFGSGGQGGSTNTLFFAAGNNNYKDGLFGTLTAN